MKQCITAIGRDSGLTYIFPSATEVGYRIGRDGYLEGMGIIGGLTIYNRRSLTFPEFLKILIKIKTLSNHQKVDIINMIKGYI